MTEIDPIFLATTIIKRYLGDTDRGTTTGFFYTKQDKIYLVTNKHVIYGDNFSDKKAVPIVDKFKLILHTDKSNLLNNEEVTVELYKNKKKLWLEHENNEIDVICVPISLDRQKYLFVGVGDDLIDVGNIRIGFEKIFVMGYPFGWYDSVFNLPITRIGHLSSPFGVPFSGKPYMLGDVETHKGMSGSPVFMFLRDYITRDENGNTTINMGTIKYILLGVYSGQPLWQIPDTITNDIKSIPHSLGNIWFAQLIRDITKDEFLLEEKVVKQIESSQS